MSTRSHPEENNLSAADVSLISEQIAKVWLAEKQGLLATKQTRDSQANWGESRLKEESVWERWTSARAQLFEKLKSLSGEQLESLGVTPEMRSELVCLG